MRSVSEHAGAGLPTADAITTSFSRLVAVAGRLLVSVASIPAFKDVGVNVSEWLALEALNRTDPLNNNQLARRLGVTRQRAHQIISALLRAELIVMKVSPTDSRRNEIMLTDSGRACLANLDGRLGLFLSEVPAIDARDIRAASRHARRLVDAIESKRSGDGRQAARDEGKLKLHA